MFTQSVFPTHSSAFTLMYPFHLHILRHPMQPYNTPRYLNTSTSFKSSPLINQLIPPLVIPSFRILRQCYLIATRTLETSLLRLSIAMADLVIHVHSIGGLRRRDRLHIRASKICTIDEPDFIVRYQSKAEI